MTEEVGYRKTYSLRRAIPGARSLEVTFPFEVVEQEARSRGMSVDDFIRRFKVIAEYGGVAAVRYSFTEDSKSAEEAS